MAKTVVGLFDTAAEAQNVVQDLTNSGFQRSDISLVANDASGEYAQYRTVGGTESGTAEGAGAGAVGGGVLGGVLGLLVGIGALAIPGIGPVVAAGPLVAALTGAGIGAAAGGLIGALVGAGIPEEDAGFYAEGVRRGGTLVMVKSSDDMAQRAFDIMQRHGAVDVDERSTTWRQSGWTRFDPDAEPYTGTTDIDDKWERSSKIGTAGGAAAGAATGAAIGSAGGPVGTAVGGVAGAVAGAGVGAAGDVAGETIEQGYGRYDDDFRTHYQSNAASSGYTYEQYTPVYRYGYGLANDPMYRDRDWADIEPEARRRWEERNPNTWEQFKASVRYAWERAKDAID